MIYDRANALKVFLPITPDERNKPDKWYRIETTLEPVNRLGHLIFNIQESEDPNMKRLEAQFKSASRKQKKLGRPDMVEGGVVMLRDSQVADLSRNVEYVKCTNSKRL